MLSSKPFPSSPAAAKLMHATFPKVHPYLRATDELGNGFTDRTFAALFRRRGQPALAPWRMALATILQFAEGLSDRRPSASPSPTMSGPRTDVTTAKLSRTTNTPAGRASSILGSSCPSTGCCGSRPTGRSCSITASSTGLLANPAARSVTTGGILGGSR